MDAFESYLKAVKARLLADLAQKEATLSELRSHLWEDLNELTQREPGADPETLKQRVLDRFGTPDAVAAAYNPPGSLVVADDDTGIVLTVDSGVTRAAKKLRDQARRGLSWSREQAPRWKEETQTLAREVALAIVIAARGVARILGGALRWIAGTLRVAFVTLLVILAIVLVAATLTGIFLFDDIRAEVGARLEDRVLHTHDDCRSAPCDQTTGPLVFHLGEHANRFTFHIDLQPATGSNGTARITVTDPSGARLLEHEAPPGHSRTRETFQWEPRMGDWHLEYTLEGYEGTLALSGWVRGVDL